MISLRVRNCFRRRRRRDSWPVGRDPAPVRPRCLLDDAAQLDQVGQVGALERDARVLLDQDHGQALATAQVHHHVHDLLHDQRRQADGRFVQQQHARMGDQGAADGDHLLLAAGQRAGQLLAPLRQYREQRVDAFQLAREIGAAAEGVGAQARLSSTFIEANSERFSGTRHMPRRTRSSTGVLPRAGLQQHLAGARGQGAHQRLEQGGLCRRRWRRSATPACPAARRN